MADETANILFICTANSARSILAEALMNEAGAGRVRAWSAGSHPGGVVNAHALQVLRELGVPAEGARSKSWDEFSEAGAPRIDVVLTVCDNAAGEACPLWPGRPMTAHWGVPDPAADAGSEADVRQAFRDAATTLKRRIDLMLTLPLGTLDAAAMTRELRAIGDR